MKTYKSLAILVILLSGWLLLAAAPVLAATCGNGIVESPEVCDDGATLSGDGCSATCTLEPNTCIDNVTGVTNNCTANDVQLAVIAEIVESDGCDFPGDTAQVQIQTELIATAAERYDIGIFIALDGGTARTGACHHNYLPPPLADLGAYDPGSSGLGNGTGPFYDAEIDEDPADSCGDLEQGVDTFYDLQNYSFSGARQTLTIKCVDSDGNGLVDVGSCVSWDNQKNQTCTSVGQTVPNTRAKCRCETLNTNLAFPGRILIDKITDPSGDPTSFDFNLAGGPDGVDIDFNLTDATPVFGPGPNNGFFKAGSYTVSELVPGGWDLTALACNDADGGTVVNLGTATATIDLDPGQTITCTFTDTKRSRILIDKVTNPAADPQLFDFTLTGGPDAINQAFQLADATAPRDSGTLKPGTYNAAETVPAGWDLTSATCSDGSAPGSISLSVGETVTCTFTNTKRGRIIVDKVTNPAGDPQSFSFDAGGAGYADFSLTDAAAPNDQELAPGTYSVSETVPAGWNLTSATCSDGSPINAINLAAGETVTCTFTNTKRGRILVIKRTDPAGDPQAFSFLPSWGAAFGLIDGQQNDSGALPPGQYSVSESPQPGWDLVGASCVSSIGDTENAGAIELDAGETVVCTLLNRKRGMVTVLKTSNGVVDPMRSIDFTLTGPDLPPGGVTSNTFGDADGVLEFNGAKLIPGATYTVCENPVPAGWTSAWELDGGGVTPYNPDVPEDNGVRCYDFTVTPGQTRAFEVDNSRPGGDPRTIGYWKNWNRCTRGRQAEVAAKNGGAAAGFFLVEDVLPQTVGDLAVTTCPVAVDILNKSDIVTHQKKAGDAAYGMAAQLLAAKLNHAAGAETCPAVQNAMTAGQQLLDTINFTGTGDYLGSKVKGVQLQQRQQALSLAATLDSYNNGNLCSP